VGFGFYGRGEETRARRHARASARRWRGAMAAAAACRRLGRRAGGWICRVSILLPRKAISDAKFCMLVRFVHNRTGWSWNHNFRWILGWIVIGCMVAMFYLGSEEYGQQQLKKNMDNKKINLSRPTSLWRFWMNFISFLWRFGWVLDE